MPSKLQGVPKPYSSHRFDNLLINSLTTLTSGDLQISFVSCKKDLRRNSSTFTHVVLGHTQKTEQLAVRSTQLFIFRHAGPSTSLAYSHCYAIDLLADQIRAKNQVSQYPAMAASPLFSSTSLPGRVILDL